MSDLTIQSESLPKRCEVCHQSDCLDAVKNYCSRCNNVIGELAFNKSKQLNSALVVNNNSHQLIKPDSINIKYGGDKDIIIYKWQPGSPVEMQRVIISLLILFINWNQHPIVWSIIGISFLLNILSVLAQSINNTYITISSNQLLVKDSPISLKKKQTINIDDISDIFYEAKNKQNTVFVKLNSGRKQKIASSYENKDSMLYIERLIKNKIKRNR